VFVCLFIPYLMFYSLCTLCRFGCVFFSLVCVSCLCGSTEGEETNEGEDSCVSLPTLSFVQHCLLPRLFFVFQFYLCLISLCFLSFSCLVMRSRAFALRVWVGWLHVFLAFFLSLIFFISLFFARVDYHNDNHTRTHTREKSL